MGRRGVEDDRGRGDGGHGADERGAEHFYAEGQEREEVQAEGGTAAHDAGGMRNEQAVSAACRSWLRAEDSEALDTVAAGGEVITAAQMGSGCRGC
jgi:hypothetical protein